MTKFQWGMHITRIWRPTTRAIRHAGRACRRPTSQREEVGDGSSACELVVGGVQEPFDGFDAEVFAELGV